MSFKREGDDKGLFVNIRKRRIIDLFAEDVPEDEAKLISNGRFACLVCHHKPVFDTVNMLMIHRKGKKHMSDAHRFFKEKRELAVLVRKRQHEQYLKDGTTNIQQAAPSMTQSIQLYQPYDPRVKKHKPCDRKPRVDLRANAEGPLLHSHQLMKICQPQSLLECQPYTSKKRVNLAVSSTLPSRDIHTSDKSYQPLIPDKANPPQIGGATSQYIQRSRSDYLPLTAMTRWGPNSLIDDEKIYSMQNEDQAMNSSDSVNRFLNAQMKFDSSLVEGSCNNYDRKTSNFATVSGGTCVNDNTKEEKKKFSKKCLQLRGAGWKRDWDGKWIRDKDAEFDSDEEPPDIP